MVIDTNAHLFYSLKFVTAVALNEKALLRCISYDQSFEIGERFVIDKLADGYERRDRVDNADTHELRTRIRAINIESLKSFMHYRISTWR